MKANLTRFVNTLARLLGLGDWSVEVNTEAEGGQVVVVVGNYLSRVSLHKDLLERNRSAGNAIIDLLACVPPVRVRPDPGSGALRPSRASTEGNKDNSFGTALTLTCGILFLPT